MELRVDVSLHVAADSVSAGKHAARCFITTTSRLPVHLLPGSRAEGNTGGDASQESGGSTTALDQYVRNNDTVALQTCKHTQQVVNPMVLSSKASKFSSEMGGRGQGRRCVGFQNKSL